MTDAEKKDKAIKKIMAEYEADGIPCTYAEAEEVYNMEIKENGKRHYEKSATTKKSNKVRKVDEEKGYILKEIKVLIEGMQMNKGQTVNVALKTETELSFNYNGNEYTLKLTKHRKGGK